MILLSLFFLTSAIAVVSWAMYRAKSFGSRVVALDILAVIAVGILLATAYQSDHPVIIDAGLVLALVAFLGTTALGLFVGRKEKDDDK